MIGSRIKRLREDRRYSQEYMAEMLNITQAAYSKLESDHTNLHVDRLKEIAKLLAVTEADLLSGDTDIFDQPASAQAYQNNIEFLEKTVELLKRDNEHLRITNQRLLNIIEQNQKNKSG